MTFVLQDDSLICEYLHPYSCKQVPSVVVGCKPEKKHTTKQTIKYSFVYNYKTVLFLAFLLNICITPFYIN